MKRSSVANLVAGIIAMIIFMPFAAVITAISWKLFERIALG